MGKNMSSFIGIMNMSDEIKAGSHSYGCAAGIDYGSNMDSTSTKDIYPLNVLRFRSESVRRDFCGKQKI